MPTTITADGGVTTLFRTVGDQPSLGESLLPEEVLRLPTELARVNGLLHHPAFFAPFDRHFDPLICRPSTPVEAWDGCS